MCALYVSFGSKVRFHGLYSVVYFEVQMARIFCRVWSEQCKLFCLDLV